MGFEPVEQQPHFPSIEERVLGRWRERDVFARSLQARAEGPLFSFYEGPPTANGRPGVHHVEARAFKDVFLRYRTMKGHRVPRRAGWDCHGIPVELESERLLGFTRKQDIEDYGVAAFNAQCRELVTRYVDDWARLTERIGFWVDLSDAYWTMSATYIDSVWWSLARLFDEGLMYEDYKVVPYCPRCGTALSDHEVAQGYATAVDPSVYVRFPVTEGWLAQAGASLLVWTTTPWTLLSNTAVAVGPDIRYVLARARKPSSSEAVGHEYDEPSSSEAVGHEYDEPSSSEAVEHEYDDYPVVLAADLVEAALGEGAMVHREIAVAELQGLHYRGPYEVLSPDPAADWRYVTLADFVTTSEGTGIVHLAPAFGEDDMRLAREHDLPVLNPVDLEGRFRVGPFAGRFVKDADAEIVEDLRARGLLLRAGLYSHTYPFCWRCRTPLLYYAKPSWYIATTRIRDRLMAVNAGVDWHPEHIRDGRYGDWLANNVDWALSRERYWGTPLPLWRCVDCARVTAVGSRAELGRLASADLAELDPHRPFVDEVVVACPGCGGQARRVPEVIDAWYDSGSMPFAQFGYPHLPASREVFDQAFPADFIVEAIDQTRGWFYSLMAVSTLLFDRNSYRTVLCLGHIVDADGKKMSKSLGNILEPWDLISTRGADALRWLLLTDGSPWVPRRVGPQPLDEVVRRFLLTLWNAYYFFATYARLEGWAPDPDPGRGSGGVPPVGERPVLDRWVLAELADTVEVVDAGLEAYDTTTAGRRVASFVDDLSNWYIRRSRARFWSADPSAFATLHECLVTIAALLAPFTPFVADELYENLVRAVDRHAPDSVHLLDFPVADKDAVDERLRAAMASARRVVELGRRARNEARVAVRQPLRRAVVTLPAEERAGWEQVREVVADELNVKAIDLTERAGALVTYRLKPNFRALGPDFGGRTPAVAAAIASADAEAVAAALAADGSAEIGVDGELVLVRAEQVQVIEDARTGWQVAREDAYSVALDLDIDQALRQEGLARELVRAVNDLRKRLGLELDDRVELEVAADGEVAEALAAQREAIAAEVLATALRSGPAEQGEELDLGGRGRLRVLLRVRS